MFFASVCSFFEVLIFFIFILIPIYIVYFRSRSTLSHAFDINIQSVYNKKLQPNTENSTYTMAKTGVLTNSGFMYWCCLHFNLLNFFGAHIESWLIHALIHTHIHHTRLQRHFPTQTHDSNEIYEYMQA